jgi:RNA polymerase sigma-B factor
MTMAPALQRDRPRPRSRQGCVSETEKRRDHELLARFADTRSPELREQLVRRFIPLARSLAKRYSHRSEPLDDLIQVASLGLVKAIDGFDPERGRPFTSYAVPTILGELRRHFRDHVWNLRLPRALGELSMTVERATDALTGKLGRSPTVGELAARMGVSTEDVLEAMEADHARKTASLDESRRREDDGIALLDTIGEAEAGFERVEAELAAADAGLDEREQRVVRMRFVDGLTQKEAGERIGCSQMQVSRIQRKALRKLLGAVRGQSTSV